MDVASSVVTCMESPELMQAGQRPFHDPTVDPMANPQATVRFRRARQRYVERAAGYGADSSVVIRWFYATHCKSSAVNVRTCLSCGGRYANSTFR